MGVLRILLAEAHRGHRKLLLRALTAERPFVQVHTVTNGEQFRRQLAYQQYDCAVMSYHLPDTDASEVLRMATADADTPPVLVVSGCLDQGIVIDSFRNGSTDFVPAAEASVGDRLWRRIERAVRLSREQNRRRRYHERRQRWLLEASETDVLTGLHNRRFLTRQLRECAYQRDRRRMMSCIMMDLDHFKRVNDRHGHVAGDDVLTGVAAQVRSCLRGGDVAVRWGGEEFIILLASTDLAEGWIWAERLKARLRRLRFGHGRNTYGVTASFGVVSMSTCRMSSEVIDMADQAMYLAKRRGRDQVCTWSMVQIERALSVAGQDTSKPPGERRRLFLEACGDVLGPTQRDHVTDHCSRVQQVAEQWARMLNLGGEEITCIGTAGLIHDLGKCLIPEEILAQASPLTSDQWRLLNRRAEFGALMGGRLGFSPRSVDYVREHPLALGADGEGARLGAKLVAMADTVVAMRSHRTYRPIRSTAAVLTELRRSGGTPVDAAVLRSLLGASPASSTGLS